jgi:hypothetical protein
MVSLHDVGRVPAEAVPYLRTIDGRPPSEDEAQAAHERGVRWMRRAETTSDTGAAENAVQELVTAVRLAEGRPRQQAQFLNNLGYAWRVRFDLSGELEHLTQAIEATRRGVDLFAPDDPQRGVALNSLGGLLFARAQRLGDPGELDAAIVTLREARDNIEPGSNCAPPSALIPLPSSPSRKESGTPTTMITTGAIARRFARTK